MLDGIVYRDREKLEQVAAPCPPPDATRPEGDVFYRFVKSDPVDVSAEFKAYQDDHPDRKVHDPCFGWAVSVYRPESKAKKELERFQKLGWPDFKISRLCPIILTAEAGAILRTSRKRGHYAWWPADDFNIQRHLVEGDETTGATSDDHQPHASA